MKDKATPAQEQMLNHMLDAFRQLGPIESLDWFATYFDGYSKAMAQHGHPAPWCDDLVRDVRAIIERAKRERGRLA